MLPRYHLFIVMLLLFNNAEARQFRESFGPAWIQAEQMMKKCQIHLDEYFPLADARLMASAIVFPELIRYHTLRDQMETTALKTLYVQYGKQYANFSIGYFQMKPSFAEEVEKAWMMVFPDSDLRFDTLQTIQNRLKRVAMLSAQQGQVEYLYCFYRLMEMRLQQVPGLSADDSVRLMATTYNSGLSLSMQAVEKLSLQCFFHTALWPSSSTPRYNYASIALEYFRHQIDSSSSNRP